MKVKFLSFSILFFFSVFVLPEISGVSASEISEQHTGDIQKFQVSAYYSPVPNQEKYVSGNYEADLKMNGNGTHGADGTAVYVGMISAPSKYKFGTQIYIPGLGVGTVHDRGGAIYSTKGYDRLDIWFGRGDAGRVRAIQWGRKTVDGIILSEKITNTLEISTAEVSRKKTENVSYNFTKNFSRGDKHEDIKNIQKFLIEQGVFSGDTDINNVTKFYGKQTENSVFLFQKSQKILKNWSDAGAGNWGPKTREAARRLIITPMYRAQKTSYNFTKNFSRGDKHEDIKKIQKFLIQQGVFSGDTDINTVTNFYGKQTENSVFLFQKNQKILKNWSDAGAGNWGPMTRKAANKNL